jgi:hypothetical protein
VVDVVGLAGHADGVLRPAEPDDRLVERLPLAGGDDDLRAVSHQPLRDGQADAPAGSGHDRRTAREPRHRLISLPTKRLLSTI